MGSYWNTVQYYKNFFERSIYYIENKKNFSIIMPVYNILDLTTILSVAKYHGYHIDIITYNYEFLFHDENNVDITITNTDGMKFSFKGSYNITMQYADQLKIKYESNKNLILNFITQNFKKLSICKIYEILNNQNWRFE